MTKMLTASHHDLSTPFLPLYIGTSMLHLMECIARPVSSQFDSDSRPLMLDDGASSSIADNIHDFIHPPKMVNYKVRVIKGHANATHLGMINWHIGDDTGQKHALLIHHTHPIPKAPTRMLSPQHLTQQANDHAITTSKSITLGGGGGGGGGVFSVCVCG